MVKVVKPIDVTPFLDFIESANSAFAIDPAYTEAMCHTAVRIIEKRQTWQIRAELRTAEAEAMATCETSQPFECDNGLSPCGTHLCKWASTEMAAVRVDPGTVANGGKSLPRPQAGSSTPTRADAAVAVLRELRGEPDLRDAARAPRADRLCCSNPAV